VTIGSRLPHRGVMEFLREPNARESPPGQRLGNPAKIFEYVQFRCWLLALATPESAVGLLLDGAAAPTS